MIKKFFKYLGILIVLLLAILVTKTLLFHSNQMEIEKSVVVEVMDQSIENLSHAIQFKTVSVGDEINDTSDFKKYHQFLQETYPLIHQTLEKQVFNKYALLYKWDGKNNTQKPIVLMAHQDVVPVVEEEWERPPFSGLVEDGDIWGRGTLDDKSSMVSILESVEKLLKEGYMPERTIYLAFGDDEEVGGKGAKSIAAYLSEKGVEAEMVLDEGMVITSGIIPMVTKPVATIGTSEKGYLSVILSTDVEGGHSSMPQPETAISILSKAIVSITDNRLEARFSQPVQYFLDFVGPEIPWPARIVFANRWLLGGVLKNIYTGSGAGNATVRTTTAPTMFNSGIKDNILPTTAQAIVNFRLLPGDTKEDIVNFLKKRINDDRVKIEAPGGDSKPIQVSPVDCESFEILHKSIKESFGDVIVAPTLMLGSSDSRHYSKVSDNIYRFAPYHLTPEMLETIHGNNERISIENYKAMIGFYYRLIKNF